MKFRMFLMKWMRTLDGSGISMCGAWSEHNSLDGAIRYCENQMGALNGGTCFVLDHQGRLHFEWTRPGDGKKHDPALDVAPGFYGITTGEWVQFIEFRVPWNVLEGKS